jgi:cardiolipin synthase
MRGAGIQVSPTSPLYHLHTISYRNHRKITVIRHDRLYRRDEHRSRTSQRREGFCILARYAGSGGRRSHRVLQSVFMVDRYNAVKENLFFRPVSRRRCKEMCRSRSRPRGRIHNGRLFDSFVSQ